MLSRMIGLLLVITFLNLTGCAVPVKYEVPNLNQSAQFVVKDLRPEVERETKLFSFLITSKAYGVRRIGDGAEGLTPVRLMQHRVHEMLKPNSFGTEVKVHHFVSYINFRASAKRGALGAAIGGMFGTLLVSSTQSGLPLPPGISYVDPEVFASSIEEEYVRGHYTEEENPNKSDVIVVFLDAEMNGQRTFLRRISRMDPNEKANHFMEAVDATIQAFLLENNKTPLAVNSESTH